MGPVNSIPRSNASIHSRTPFRAPFQGNPSTRGSCPQAGSGTGITRSPAETCSDQMRETFRPQIFSSILYDSQERREMAPHSEFASTQQVYSSTQIQDGDSTQHTNFSRSRTLGSVNRSEGRISSHSGTSGRSGVPMLLLPETTFSFRSDAVRPLNGTPNFHESNKNPRGLSAPERHSNLYVYRRLAGGSGLEGPLPHRHALRYSRSSEPRLDCKSRKVQLHPHPNTSLSGGSVRPACRVGVPNRGETGDPYSLGPRSLPPTVGSGTDMAGPSGVHGQYGGSNPILPPEDETYPMAPLVVLPTLVPSVPNVSPGYGSDPSPPTVVVPRTEPLDRGPVSATRARRDPHNGRVPHRLGCLHRRGNGLGALASTVEHVPHKSVGIGGSLTRSNPLLRSSFRSKGSHSYRQHNSCRLHQQARRHTFIPSVAPILAPFSMGYPGGSLPSGDSPPRDTQRQGGHTVPPKSDTDHFSGHLRVAAKSVGVPTNPNQVSSVSRNRSVRLPDEQPTPTLLQPVPSRVSLEGERPILHMGRSRFLRLPFTGTNSSSANEGNGGQAAIIHPGSPILAVQTMVPQPNQAVGGTPVQAPSVTRPSVITRGEHGPHQPSQPVLSGVALIRESFIQAGLSQEAADLASQGRRPSTLGLYSKRLRLYGEWCSSRTVNPSNATLGEIADFLLYVFNLGRQVNTIRGYRSAIAAIHSGFADGSSISNSTSLNHLIKGMFLKRPTLRPLIPVWSLTSVLETLASAPFEPLHSCDLKFLTLKTVFLVSLASGRRRSAIQALSASRGHLNFLPHGVRLIPEPAFLAKNQTVDFLPHPIFIPKISSFSSVREDKVWCPVRALSWYVERTKAFRTPSKMALFLTHRAPHDRASASTISRWIVEAISANPQSLTGPGTPRAHDVRGVAASWALFQGVPLDEILRNAVWKNPNSFISCYLTDVLRDEGRFGRAALSGVHSTTTVS